MDAREQVLSDLSKKYAAEVAASKVASAETQFSYAACLSESSFRDDLQTAVRLLTGTIAEQMPRSWFPFPFSEPSNSTQELHSNCCTVLTFHSHARCRGQPPARSSAPAV